MGPRAVVVIAGVVEFAGGAIGMRRSRHIVRFDDQDGSFASGPDTMRAVLSGFVPEGAR